MLDEFGLLGRFEVFAEAMSHMAGFGLRACLAVQSFNQIYKSYGRHETITSNCDTTVRFTPNDLGTAEEISRLIGQTNVRHEHRTQSGGSGTVSEPEVGRSLMTADEVRRMSVEEVLIFARGQRPIRAPLLKYHEVAYFRRLAEIEPPANSDRIVAEPAAEDVPNNSPVMVAAAAQTLPQADLPLGWALNHAAKESGGK
jgi:type IV secretion system protein VirD4